MTKSTKRIQKDEALKLLDAGGVLSQFLKGFEPRKQQLEMMGSIIDAFNGSEIALIEAGTGTGKSLAYLIPAIMWNRCTSERTVISTNTINLQEQLIHKDIPLIIKALNIEFNAVLVKGMGNYICLRKLQEAKLELPLMTPQEAQELEKIEAWSSSTRDGSRSTLPIVPSSTTWEKVGAERDTCNKSECTHFKECFYYKARWQAQEANLLVVNHHLLFSDLIARDEETALEDSALLPPYTRVILDEAHNIEEIATDFFADHLSQSGFLRTLSRLSSERQGKPHGKLALLKQQIHTSYPGFGPHDASSILQRLDNDLSAQRWDVMHWTNRVCEAFEKLSQALSPQKSAEDNLNPGENRLRLLPFHQTHPHWEGEIIPYAQQFLTSTDKFMQSLDSLQSDVLKLKHERLHENTKSILFDIKALAERLKGACGLMKEFIQTGIPPDKVRWIEVQARWTGRTTTLYEAGLDISKDLVRFLFNRFPTSVLVSATLATNKDFTFIRKRLGLVPEMLEHKNVIQKIYDSPFDYKKQVMLAIPTDIPHPQDPAFLKEAVAYIWSILQISRGNAFILFTSYTMLKTCYTLLADKLREQRYNPLKQGDTNRQTLIQQFKETDRSVLFATDSFWEGVDVAGEALRCVILVKLPFKVPSEPMLQARCESIQAKGGDPFAEYSLPQAVVKFKQGFGRLIRNRKDRGCVVCLDSRLLSRPYGKLFLGSLPECQQVFADKESLKTEMEAFYRRTYHLVKSA